MDLAQAESVADLIDASSETAARSALKSLKGAFSNEIHVLVDELITLRMLVEATLDFPEEEIDFLADRELRTRMTSVRARFDAIEAAAVQGRVLRDGMTVESQHGRREAGR